MRDKQIAAGLFLSRFDREGLEKLGFQGFSEAFNAIGYSLGGKPASIKNYRDEFDPYFSNPRKGWHKRPLREHCEIVREKFSHYSLDDFASFVSEMMFSPPLPEDLEEIAKIANEPTASKSFAQRLETGIAAEGFFAASFVNLPEFSSYSLVDVTRLGCGFDFKLQREHEPFTAVEVKGLAGLHGDIQLTEKEHCVATHLEDRYVLCVVKNFVDRPFLELYRNPIASSLQFVRRERTLPVVSWHARISR